jgi:hypothetical protein
MFFFLFLSFFSVRCISRICRRRSRHPAIFEREYRPIGSRLHIPPTRRAPQAAAARATEATSSLKQKERTQNDRIANENVEND